MRRVLFCWRGVEIHSYPALLALGIVCGVVAGVRAGGSIGLPIAPTLAAMLLLVIPALVGARLLHVVSHWARYHGDWSRLWSRSEGGAGLFGGLILAVGVSVPLLAAFDLPFGAFWDAATITMLVGMVIARMGCFLNGCCAGRPSRSWLAMWLPNVHGVWCRRLPTQLIEAAVGGVLLAASIAGWGQVPRGGAVFLANLAAYAAARCVLEGMRDTVERVGRIALQRAIALGLMAVAVVGLAVPWPAGKPTADPTIVASEPDAWSLLLTPLSVLAIFALFRFVGCEAFGTTETPGYEEKPTGEPDYPGTVLDEKMPGSATSAVVSYWRLQQMAVTDPAKDETNVNNGVYKLPTDPGEYPKERPPDLSPPGSTIIADRLKLQQPGLLEFEPAANNHSMAVFGGYVEIPFSPTLNLDAFSVEALVVPAWDFTISTMKKARFFSVVEFGGVPPKKTGFAIYAGPEDINDPTKGLYRWQLWMGDGAKFQRVILGPVVQPNKTNFVAISYDAATKDARLYVYYQGIDISTCKTTPGTPVTFVKNSTSVPLLIGMGRSLLTNNAEPRYPFRGRIQEVAYYKRAMTEDRLCSHIPAAMNL